MFQNLGTRANPDRHNVSGPFCQPCSTVFQPCSEHRSQACSTYSPPLKGEIGTRSRDEHGLSNEVIDHSCGHYAPETESTRRATDAVKAWASMKREAVTRPCPPGASR
jgi:hypothetical protein